MVWEGQAFANVKTSAEGPSGYDSRKEAKTGACESKRIHKEEKQTPLGAFAEGKTSVFFGGCLPVQLVDAGEGAVRVLVRRGAIPKILRDGKGDLHAEPGRLFAEDTIGRPCLFVVEGGI